VSTRVTELLFRVETTSSDLSGDAATSTTASLRISVAPTLLVLAKDDETRIIDFVRQTMVRLDHAARTREQEPLFATVHDRVAGYWSALHVKEVLAAAGSDAFGSAWQLQAAYAIRHVDAEPTPMPERLDAADGSRWTIEGLEIAHYQASEVELDRRSLTRLLAHAARVHPDVAPALIADGRVPALLRTQNHFPAVRVDERLTLVEAREQVELDVESLIAAYKDAPAKSPVLALARRQLDGPRPDHLAVARASIDDKRLVEAQLACMAFSVSEIDSLPAQALLREIDGRAGRFSAARRLFNLIAPTQDPKAVAKRATKLARLRRKAGRYAYMLDVFIGEHQLELGDYDEAVAALGRALEVDPYLVGAWISIGRAHQGRLEFAEGWQCWDQALRLRPQHNIAKQALEWCRNLAADYPQFF
jgi:tetratricopeptide (TPR) repeat protein